MKTCPCSATLRFAVPILFLAAVAADSATSQVVVGLGGGTPGTSQNFTVVGHNPLFNRGMNAALAIFDHFVYIGNRSDGSNSCGDLNGTGPRSEEHTSELQSPCNLVCRLLLEKKKSRSRSRGHRA